MQVTIKQLKNGYSVCKGDDEQGEFFESLEAIPPLAELMGETEEPEMEDNGESRIGGIVKDLEGKMEKPEPKYADMGEEEESSETPKGRLFGKFKRNA